MPFWLLNGDLDAGEIKRSLHELYDKGIYSFFLQPRTGLEIPYLSEEYWQHLDILLRAARELDMQAWWCDDYNWPSGTAGGALLRTHPEYRQNCLDCCVRRAQPGMSVRLMVDGDLLAAVAVNTQTSDLIRLEDQVRDGVLEWAPALEMWDVVLCTQRLDSQVEFGSVGAPFTEAEAGCLDILNPAAVAEFIHLAYDALATHLGEYLGTTLPGIFTRVPPRFSTLLWSEGLLDLFAQRRGYDLHPRIHELGLAAGNYTQTRYDYHTLITELYEHAYLAQIRAWCDRHGLVLSGHLSYGSDQVAVACGEFRSLAKHTHMPALSRPDDETGRVSCAPANNLNANLAAKCLSSSAHAACAARALGVLGEGGGWDTSPARLVADIHWATACGLDAICPHAVFTSTKGLRKRDLPGSYSAQQPWWPHCEHVVTYTERQCRAAGWGQHVADLLLLYPQHSLRAEYAPGQTSSRLRDTCDALAAIATALLRIQRDYDVLFEETVSDGEVQVKGNRLQIGQESYRVLVLPPMAFMPVAVARLLLEFYENGGLLVALGQLPTGSEHRTRDPQVSTLLAEIFSLPPLEPAGRVTRGEQPPTIHRHPNGGRALFAPLPPTFDCPRIERILQRSLDELLVRDISVQSDHRRELFVTHRRLEHYERYFIANLADEQVNATISLNATGAVSVTQPLSGESKLVTVYQVSAGRTEISWEFSAGSGVWFEIDGEDSSQPHAEQADFQITALAMDPAGITLEGIARGTECHARIADVEYRWPTVELKPIVLDSAWQLAAAQPNTWVLGPWAARLPDTEWWEESATGPLSCDGTLPRSTRLLAQTARWAARLANTLSRGTHKLPTSQFVPLAIRAARLATLANKMGLEPGDLGSRIDLATIEYLAEETSLLPPRIPAGARYVLETHFTVTYLPDDIDLAYEDLQEPLRLWVNNQPLDALGRAETVWDTCNRIIPVRKHLRIGRNTLRIESRMPSFPTKSPITHGIEPIVLRGAFGVRENAMSQPLTLVELDDWRQLGYPHYAGELIYRQAFTLPPTYVGQQLYLECDHVRETLQVGLNGVLVGTCIAPPYRVDISSQARAGENQLELRVTNTAENLLGCPLPAGIMGQVRIVPYERLRAGTSPSRRSSTSFRRTRPRSFATDKSQAEE